MRGSHTHTHTWSLSPNFPFSIVVTVLFNVELGKPNRRYRKILGYSGYRLKGKRLGSLTITK